MFNFPASRIALASSFLCVATGALATDQLVIGLKTASVERAAKLVSGWGKVLGTDGDPRIFVIDIKTGVSVEQAQNQLQNKSGVVFALDGQWRHMNVKNDLNRVKNYTNYLRAKAKLDQVSEDEKEERLGIWEAYQYFLQKRVGADGLLDEKAYIKAATHREGMPPARIKRSGSGGPLDPSGVWSFIGPYNTPAPYNQYFGVGPVSGRITGVAYDPSDANTIYVSAANGGVWKTTDGGVNWTSKSGSDWPYLYASCVAVDPSNPQIVYAGTGDIRGQFALYSKGIMKSTNGGDTWTYLTDTAQFNNNAVSKIVVDPDQTSTILCTTGEGAFARVSNDGKVWRSTNGGTTWTACSPTPTAYTDLDYGVKNGSNVRRFWAVGSGHFYNPGFDASKIWTSVDHGATWTQVTNVAASPAREVDVAASKIDPDTVYVLAANSNKIWKSTTAGSSWTDITAGFPNGAPTVGSNYNWAQSFYDYHISTSTCTVSGVTKDAVYVGLITLSMSPDAGATWVDISRSYSDAGDARMHSDQHSFTTHPTDPNTVLVTGDGGLFRYVHDPASPTTGAFTSLNKKIGITQFYHMSIHPSDTSWVQGGTQDNSTPASRGNLANWSNPGAGDGSWSDIGNTNPLFQFVSSQNLSIYVTEDGFATPRVYVGNPDTGSSRSFIAPAIMSNDNAVIWAGTTYLNKWTLATHAWTIRLGAKDFVQPLISIAICPDDNNKVYVANQDLWVTPDQGANWTQIDGGAAALPNGLSINSIEPNPSGNADVLVTVGGFGGGHVFRCGNVNASDATRVWTDVSGVGATGLPDVPHFATARDPFDPNNTWYVGNDLGVFMTTDAGATWTNATAPLGLPNVTVNKLVVSHDNYLYAATFGRGIWKIKLSNPATLAVDSVEANPWLVIGGQSFTGTVRLTGNAGAGGQLVTLSDDTGSIDTPPTVIVPAGTSQAGFNCTTSPVGAAAYRKVFATAGSVTKFAWVRLIPVPKLNSLAFDAPSVTGGTSIGCTVTLVAVAQQGGNTVALTDNSSAITPPSSVLVTENTGSKSFTVATSEVAASATRTVTATLNGTSRSASLTLTPKVKISTFTINPSSVIGGSPASGVLTLTGPTNRGGMSVTISDNSGSIGTPANVFIAQGASGESFPITTGAVGATATRQVTASEGSVTKVANLTLYPQPKLNTFTLSPSSVKGGNNTTGTVTLQAAAPPGGVVITVTDNSASIATPANTSVAAGTTSKSFAVGTSAVSATATRQVTVSYNGTSKVASLTLTP